MDIFSTLLAILIAAHGVGHMLFLVTLLGMADWRQVTESWLITPRFGCYVTQAVGTVVWLAATGAFLAAAFGLFVGGGYWREAAIIGSGVSLVGIFLFWKNPPGLAVLAALLVDALVLIALLLVGWPPVELIGV